MSLTAILTLAGLFQAPQPRDPLLFCRELVIVGDIDGDEIDDFVIGSTAADESDRAGEVVLVSGRAGKPLWRRAGPAGSERYGASLARLSDMDGDGVDDFVCGAPRTESSRTAGSVEVVSTRRGELLWSGAPFSNATVGAEYGANIAALPDADGDGRIDFVVSNTSDDGTELFLVSSATHAVLARAFEEGGTHGRPVVCLAAIGDWGGDGLGDLAITCYGRDPASVRVRCGRDLERIRELGAATDGDLYCTRLRAVDDFDGDGVRDVVSPASPWAPGYGGECVVSFGSRGGTSRRHATRNRGALDFRALDDMDGDGLGDYALLWIGLTADFDGLGNRVAALQVRSLKSGDPLLTIAIGTDANSDDWRLFALPDLDGDGKHDCGVVHQVRDATRVLRGYSSRDGRMLLEVRE